jgi:lipoate-protein ligase A
MSKRSTNSWRVIDTGLRPAAENIALNRALLEAHQAGEIPHTLRFLRFQPSALLGFHQHVQQELRLDRCRQYGVTIQRRITGGGAIYFDPAQLGWELYVDKQVFASADMAVIATRICKAAARGLRQLGIDARFRPRNDIEVEGRKISGTGGAFEGDSVLYQGTLLLDFDVERMLRVLRIPAEKLSDKAINSARERVINLSELLGHTPDIALVKRHLMTAFAAEFHIDFESDDKLSDAERDRYEVALREIDSDEWVFQHNRSLAETPTLSAIHRSTGGTLRVNLKMDTRRQRILQAWFHGDFFVFPRRIIPDLEAELKNIAVGEFESRIRNFFKPRSAQMVLLEVDDFVAVVHKALQSQKTAQATL